MRYGVSFNLALPQQAGTGIYVDTDLELRTMSWQNHERLYHAILTNHRSEAERVFSEIVSSHYTGETAREVFLNVCYVLYSAADELNAPFGELERLKYDSSLSSVQNMKLLNGLLSTVFAKMDAKRAQNRSVLQEKLLSYMQQHCAEYDLCAASVAEHFAMTERQVYALIRQTTEMSFNEYLVDIRMRQAARLIRLTDLSIPLIAEQCGYPVISTFYRVFKKYHGCAPAQYRNGQTNETDKEFSEIGK